MPLELTGKLIKTLPEQSGQGKKGTWVKQDFIIETIEQFPKQVCFSAWGDKAGVLKTIGTGSQLKVSFFAESREYNGRWYTDLKVWRIDLASTPKSDNSDTYLTEDKFPAVSDDLLSETGLSGQDEIDDLPF
jgi:hypothetical protein